MDAQSEKSDFLSKELENIKHRDEEYNNRNEKYTRRSR